MRTTVNRLATFLPWLGIALLLLGALSYFVTRRFALATNLPLALGALSLLLFALLRPDDVRRLFSGRRARYSASTLLAVLFFAAIGVILYFIAYQNSDWRWDLTATDQFSPLPETRQLLETAESPINAIGFYTPRFESQRQEAVTRLESLQAVDDSFNYRFVDPEANPVLAERYAVERDGTLVFVRGEGEEEQFAKASTLSDRDIHSALLQVINPVAKPAYFLAGHGERSINDNGPQGLSSIVTDLRDLGFTVEELNIAVAGSVPEDASVILQVGAQAPLQEAELAAIRDYLAAGGAALFMRDVVGSAAAARAENDGLRAMLAEEWGLSLRPDVIIEPQMALFGQQNPLLFLTFEFGTSPITPDDLSNLGVLFNVARSVGVSASEGVTPVELALTSQSSWGETDLSLQQVQPDGEDALGPLAVAASAERAEGGARVVLVGDADLPTNEIVFSNGNYLFFTNAVNWLAGDETALDLTPREVVNRQFVVPQTQLGLMQVVSWFGAPLLIAAVGLAMWYRRSQRA
ncbi:MAG: GldG family protein [Candidatus Promineifilaceae bacterium]